MQSLARCIRRAALSVLLPTLAAAQTGRIVGTVSDAAGQPLANAQTLVLGTRLGAQTGSTGRFAINGVPAGTYQVKVLLLGFRTATQENVVVKAGEDASLTISLTSAPVRLGATVVSASRQAERLTDAPATISSISVDALQSTPGSAFANALKEVKGVDVIQTGMTTVAINARGFNSSFNNRMLMMEDGRIAVLPENGLPAGSLTTIPKIDLAGVEVLVGPGAALYGPDASNGVLTLNTKDPKLFPGTTAEISGGTRSYQNVQLRHASVFGNNGFKVSGEFLSANEFENTIKYAPVAAGRDSTPEISADWKAKTIRGTGAYVRYMGDARLEASAGMSLTDGIGQTNVGRNQLKGWKYNTMQVRYTAPNWYANVYRTQSLSGESYALNRYSTARLTVAPTVSDDSVKRLSDWPSDGQLYAAELQNNFTVAQLLGTKFVWGAQLRRDIVSSKREWLDDRLTGEDITLNQRGVYGQTETPIVPQLKLILAGRYDKHDDYDAQFSPKVGLTFKPGDNHTFRATVNKAFKSPTTLQTHFNIVDFAPLVGVFGNKRGFTIKNLSGATVGTIDPIVPEENTTLEFGYKGVIADRLFFDATVYDARYDHFMTSLLIINNPYTAGGAGTLSYQGVGAEADAQPIANPAGLRQIVLTYRNLGKAHIHGADASFRYIITEKIAVSGSTGLMKSDRIEIPTTIVLSAGQRNELQALNAPTVRWAAGMDANDLKHFSGGFTVRHSGDYFFASGINTGWIPTFTTLDGNLGYRIPSTGMSVNLGVSNLFTCTVEYEGTVQKRSNGQRACGFGQTHGEMIKMPHIGTMMFLGLRYHRQ